MQSPASDLLEVAPYGLAQAEKRAALLPRLRALCEHHYAACDPYRRVVDRVFGGRKALGFERLEDMPFLPVSLFRDHTLKSVPNEQVLKVLTSSGTTGQQVSRIYLDGETARVQGAVLVKVAQHFLGVDRLPMVVIDHPGVVKDRATFSARGAGILGMAQFGRHPFYALREDMSLDVEGLRAYLDGTRGSPLLLFGFTYMVWQFFVRALEEAGERLDLSRGVLVHSGGWKKLQDRAVDAGTFRERLRVLCGLTRVVNFYGMVEQVGGVYFENERGHLHAPIYSEIIVRDPVSLAPLAIDEPGILQVVTCVPTSYPGHSLLTDDLGVLRGEDVEGLEMMGRCFDVLGRLPKAELRGCSDTFQGGARS